MGLSTRRVSWYSVSKRGKTRKQEIKHGVYLAAWRTEYRRVSFYPEYFNILWRRGQWRVRKRVRKEAGLTYEVVVAVQQRSLFSSSAAHFVIVFFFSLFFFSSSSSSSFFFFFFLLSYFCGLCRTSVLGDSTSMNRFRSVATGINEKNSTYDNAVGLALKSRAFCKPSPETPFRLKHWAVHVSRLLP